MKVVLKLIYFFMSETSSIDQSAFLSKKDRLSRDGECAKLSPEQRIGKILRDKANAFAEMFRALTDKMPEEEIWNQMTLEEQTSFLLEICPPVEKIMVQGGQLKEKGNNLMFYWEPKDKKWRPNHRGSAGDLGEILKKDLEEILGTEYTNYIKDFS